MSRVAVSEDKRRELEEKLAAVRARGAEGGREGQRGQRQPVTQRQSRWWGPEPDSQPNRRRQ